MVLQVIFVYPNQNKYIQYEATKFFSQELCKEKKYFMFFLHFLLTVNRSNSRNVVYIFTFIIWIMNQQHTHYFNWRDQYIHNLLFKVRWTPYAWTITKILDIYRPVCISTHILVYKYSSLNNSMYFEFVIILKRITDTFTIRFPQQNSTVIYNHFFLVSYQLGIVRSW